VFPKSDEEFWNEVPSIDSEPGTGSGAAFVAAPVAPGRWRASRRVTLQALSALGGALALNVLSWLPPFRGSPAQARVGTEHKDCAGYDNAGGYSNDTAACIGGPYGKQYCGVDGWFLRSFGGTCESSGPVVVCGAGGLERKNAWRWTFQDVPYRCADGMMYWCGGQGFFICAYPNPQ
jgi:hypothetical protein